MRRVPRACLKGPLTDNDSGMMMYCFILDPNVFSLYRTAVDLDLRRDGGRCG
jgi:hypothetical protein